MTKGPETVSLRDEIIGLIRAAADRGFEAGQERDINFRFGDLIAKADALLPPKGWRLVPESDDDDQEA